MANSSSSSIKVVKSAKWLKEMRLTDYPEIYQELSRAIGLRNTLKLARLFAGQSVYFPRLERCLIPARNRAIKQGFNGANIKDLARKFGLTSRHVREIVTADKR